MFSHLHADYKTGLVLTSIYNLNLKHQSKATFHYLLFVLPIMSCRLEDLLLRSKDEEEEEAQQDLIPLYFLS